MVDGSSGHPADCNRYYHHDGNGPDGRPNNGWPALSHSAEDEKAGNIGATAFRAGMQALGYSEGQNFHLHERHADGDAALLSSLTAELLTKRVDVIVAVGTDATDAARQVTSSVPIIMAGVGDPIRAGFVFSLPYPGGNITGTALLKSGNRWEAA